jgi:competence protein ComEC
MKYLLVALIVSLTIDIFGYKVNPYFEITMIDIGQGDSTLIKTTDNRNILIDTGKDQSVIKELDSLLYPRKVLDLVIITHFDTDHFGKLAEILKYYEIKTLIIPPDYKMNKSTHLLRASLNNKGTRILVPTDEAKINITSEIYLDFIWPDNLQEYFSLPSNDSSISFVLNVGEFNAYFGGDISSEYEDKLIEEIGNVDVLKVSHHGSTTSTSEVLLENIRPEVALISSGKDNSYGHPAPSILQNLEEIGAEIFRTDLQGNITIRVLPDTYQIFTEYEGLKYQNRIENN